jgi:hypothetical protein
MLSPEARDKVSAAMARSTKEFPTVEELVYELGNFVGGNDTAWLLRALCAHVVNLQHEVDQLKWDIMGE